MIILPCPLEETSGARHLMVDYIIDDFVARFFTQMFSRREDLTGIKYSFFIDTKIFLYDFLRIVPSLSFTLSVRPSEVWFSRLLFNTASWIFWWRFPEASRILVRQSVGHVSNETITFFIWKFHNIYRIFSIFPFLCQSVHPGFFVCFATYGCCHPC